jgi:hypothetical protein
LHAFALAVLYVAWCVPKCSFRWDFRSPCA